MSWAWKKFYNLGPSGAEPWYVEQKIRSSLSTLDHCEHVAWTVNLRLDLKLIDVICYWLLYNLFETHVKYKVFHTSVYEKLVLPDQKNLKKLGRGSPWRQHWYTNSSLVSLQLRWAKKRATIRPPVKRHLNGNISQILAQDYMDSKPV